MDLPKDIDDFVQANAELREAFMALPPSHKKEYVSWIDEAKKEQTRKRRMDKMQAMILEKQKRR